MEREVAEGNLSDEEMFGKFKDLILGYSTRKVEKSHYYFKKAIAFAQKRKRVEWESDYLRQMGVIYYELGKRDSSFFYIDKAIKVVEGTEFYYEQCANYQAKGNCFFVGNEYEKALESYLFALEFNEKSKAQKIAKQQDIISNLGLDVSLLMNISGIYYRLRNFDKVIENMLLAKKIIDDNPNDRFSRHEIELLGNLAEVYMATGQPEKALPLLNKSYEIAAVKGLLPDMAYGLSRLSIFYAHERKDFNQALNYAIESVQIAEKTEMPYLINMPERNMMDAYFYLKDYKTARHYAERVLSRTENDNWDNLQDVYGKLIMIHALLGDVSQSSLLKIFFL
jgi:tetratricopeptide (TPR) repeat protein